ncbi:hypothetical protein GCM10007276_16300 [Agaricicola taiwanensis]|uniref:Flagellar hook-length control protein-like C-terminal domain-containing protein n=2 Tax=Agaricicola taiwanensis TaxID=591372 RepID=A0A8J2YGK3_9RHOB|nr:hypothetical protein GCM10007276_16300 [Agaricicola taiwanensis]
MPFDFAMPASPGVNAMSSGATQKAGTSSKADSTSSSSGAFAGMLNEEVADAAAAPAGKDAADVTASDQVAQVAPAVPVAPVVPNVPPVAAEPLNGAVRSNGLSAEAAAAAGAGFIKKAPPQGEIPVVVEAGTNTNTNTNTSADPEVAGESTSPAGLGGAGAGAGTGANAGTGTATGPGKGLADVVRTEASGVAQHMTPGSAVPVTDQAAPSEQAQGSQDGQAAASSETAADVTVEPVRQPTEAELATELKTVVKAPVESGTAEPDLPAEPAKPTPPTQPTQPVPPASAADAEAGGEAAPAPTTTTTTTTTTTPVRTNGDPAAAAAAANEETAGQVSNTTQVTAAAATAATLTIRGAGAQGEDIAVSPVVRQDAVASTAMKPFTAPQTPQDAAEAAIAEGEGQGEGAANGRDRAQGTEGRVERPRADIDALARRQPAEARAGNPTSQHIQLPESLNAAPTATAGVTQGQQVATPQFAGGNMPMAATLAVASEMVAQHRAGASRFEIRLDPPELGRIDVRLDVDKSGNVRSHLIVERSETLDLLRADQRNLERTLEQAGFKSDPNGISMSLRDDRGGSQQNARSFQQDIAQVTVSPVQDEIAPIAAPAPRPGVSDTSNLDIRV